VSVLNASVALQLQRRADLHILEHHVDGRAAALAESGRTGDERGDLIVEPSG
jgi:hypothetical protein